jgi:putative (di)nucleoside polyphosphate hydrolase
MNKLPLRPNVCMLLQNKKNQLFLGERLGEPGVWQFPQGGVEDGLSIEENVIKELHEETGAGKSLFKIISKLDAVHEYDFENIPKYAKGKWRGQAQTFWLVEFKGKDSDFKLDKFNAEFSNFRWCSPEEVENIAEPKRLMGYRKALTALRAFKN